ncbi:MAG: M20/M25/M40 family metallo-hydrolase [Clostridia bacterium]|nr:M20/M25/M40 family metallo-hydrolase [Clostridia bacterium]
MEYDMDKQITETVRALRSELNILAERSGEEKNTKAFLMKFLGEKTSLRLTDEGMWFCAVHEEPGAVETVAFRAEMDALPFGEGAAHLCGHDGHCAVLAGLGLLLEKRKLGRNIVLLFQHAEENGAGGKVCVEAIRKYGIDRIYAFHNVPGWKEDAVLLRSGTFACASRGMTLAFLGAPSHAACPEDGRNPGFAAARLLSELPQLADQAKYIGLAMATLVGAKIGVKAFGTAAGSAEVWLTLRTWFDDDLAKLMELIEEKAKAEAAADKVELSCSYSDVFQATVNDPEALRRLESICREIGLECVEVPEPFRWSEDFGHYGSLGSAVMFGIGAGTDWPQLHTENYTFNDRILPTALTLFSALAENG